MAIIYSLFGKFKPYCTEDLAEKSESAYEKELKRTIEEVTDYMSECRQEDEDLDPLASIVLMPNKTVTNWQIISLRTDDTRETLIDALTSALAKAKELENF